MRAHDAYYEPTEPVDYEPYLTMLDDLMNVSQMSDVGKVCYAILVKGAMDNAYRQGKDAG